MANATSTQLQELYVAYFGRAADPTGLDYWTEQGISQAAFAANMYAQNEFNSVYGGKSVEAQVNQIYKNLFDREADVTGLTYWTQQINLGNLEVAEIATHLIWAAQNNSGSSADKTALANRTSAAIAYTAEVKSTTAGILAYQAQSTDPWVSGNNITEAVNYLSGIDGTTEHTAAGITASVAVLTTNGDPTGVGSTFVLTTSTDSAGTTSASNGTISSNFRFTDGGNEVVTADIGTLAGADVLLDGSSTDSDVMNITANGNSGTFTANRIEKFVVDMAAGSPVLDVTNLTNFTDIEVKGSVAGTIDEIDVQQKQPNIKLDGYTRQLTIAPETFAGTTTASTSETINIELSGTTYGSSASTRSIVLFDSDAAGTLETLNITSSGTAANEFQLNAADTKTTLDVVNFLGATDLTTRVTAAEVTGVTLTATEATGNQTLKINHNGRTTTATNVNLFTGFDNIIVKDSGSPATDGDDASLTGVASGQKVTFADDFNDAVLTFKSVSGSSDTATIVLDNESSSTDTDIAIVNIQNVETVTIESAGKAGTDQTSASATNLIDSFVGDATTINVTGDTALNLDLAIDKASSGSAGSRAVTVDASGNTGAVQIETAASTGTGSVSYTITGTANADVIDNSNASNASTLTGGAGNDTITGGTGNDTIDLSGGGTNTLNVSTGTDTVTAGAGADTILFGEADVTATAQVTTITLAGTPALTNTLTVTVGGEAYAAYEMETADVAGNSAGADLALIETRLVTYLNQQERANYDTVRGTWSASSNAVAVIFTAATAVDATVTVTATASAGITETVASTTTGVDAVSVQTNITSFSTGTTDDIIKFDVSDINSVSGVATLSDSKGEVTGTDDVVVHTHTAGTTQAATAVDAGANVIKIAYSNTLNAFSDISTAMDDATLTMDSALAATDAIATVYYDADAGKAVFGLMFTGGASETFDGTVTFNEIGTASMTISAYNSLGSSNFALQA